MKKLLLSALLLCSVAVFAGCNFNQSAEDQNTNPPADQQEAPAPEQEAPAPDQEAPAQE